MKVQETIANGCQKIKDFAIATGQYAVKIAGQVSDAIKNLALKIYDIVVPLFNNMKNWVGANKQLVIASLGTAVIVVAAMAIYNRCKPAANPARA